MNRAFAIILIPPVLVLIGYVIVFRSMGVSPGYWRVVLPLAALGGAMWWFGKRGGKEVTK